jgi:hypothetical protein
MVSAEITKEEEDQEHKKEKKVPKEAKDYSGKKGNHNCRKPADAVKGQLGYNLPSHPSPHLAARPEVCQPPGQSLHVVREQDRTPHAWTPKAVQQRWTQTSAEL